MNRKISVTHKSNLSTYLGDWKSTMYMFSKAQSPMSLPQPLVSFGRNTHDLCLMLAYLDDKLTVLEETPLISNQFNYQDYAEAGVFLKASYLFFRILLDDIAGIIEYFYKKNEPKVYRGQKKGFDALLKKARNGKLPEDLSKLLEYPSSWFTEMTERRDDLVHNYESLLITFEQGKDGKKILGHFSTKGYTSKALGDIRDYFGYLLCEYQKFVDNLLDHFDTKFRDWYKVNKSWRNSTIMVGYVAIPLWWAYKYGNYRHENLQVSEGTNESP